MKGKALISCKRLNELEKLAQHYKIMEDSVKVAQEKNQKLVKRNMQLIRDIDRASSEIKCLRDRIDFYSNYKAECRSKNYLAAYTSQVTSAVMRKISILRFGFFETKIKKEDLQEIESEIRRTIQDIFFIQ